VKVKLDENLSRHLKPVLSQMGHDAVTAADEGLLSQPDSEIAAAARAEDRILLTLDIEFADLRKHRPGSHPGIIVFRPTSYGPTAVNAFIADFVRSVDLSRLASCVVVVDAQRVRVRAPEQGSSPTR
jgi:predicted nuclease of predicted toxin-antitoxin system